VIDRLRERLSQKVKSRHSVRLWLSNSEMQQLSRLNDCGYVGMATRCNLYMYIIVRVICALTPYRNPSRSYGASPAIWDHTVLPATWRRWTRPTLTPSRQVGTRFSHPVGMESWVDLGGWLYTEMVYHQSPILASSNLAQHSTTSLIEINVLTPRLRRRPYVTVCVYR